MAKEKMQNEEMLERLGCKEEIIRLELHIWRSPTSSQQIVFGMYPQLGDTLPYIMDLESELGKNWKHLRGRQP